MSTSDDLIYTATEHGLPIGITDVGEVSTDAQRLTLNLAAHGRDLESVNRIMTDTLDKIGIARMNIAAIGAVYTLTLQWVAVLLDDHADGEQIRGMIGAALRGEEGNSDG